MRTKRNIIKSNPDLMMFKYLWVIAIVSKELQFVILGAILILLLLKKSKYIFRFNKISSSLFIINTIYLFSITVNTLGSSHNRSRILAAFNTCLITYVSIFFLNYYYRRKIDLDKLRYYMFINLVILSIVYIFFVVLEDKANLSFLRPLYGPDWLNDRYELRFRGYLEYTNLVVFMYLYCIPFAFSYLVATMKPLLAVIFETASLLIIFATNSRIGIAACSLTVFLSVIIANKKSVLHNMFRKNKILISLIIIALGAVVFLAFRGRIETTFNNILALRQGSTSTRLEIYKISLERMLKESPFVGCGIKDLIGEIGFPYGSHSTYIGMFYKTGLLGGTMFLLTIIIVAIKILKKEAFDGYLFFQKIAFLALLFCFILEDLDGANWNIAVFYSLLGVFLSYNSLSKFARNKNGRVVDAEISFVGSYGGTK